MADFLNKRSSATLPKKNSNGNGFSSTSAYDDVFGGPTKFAVSSLSSGIDDYREIFGNFYAPKSSSSIPVLDFPVVEGNDVDYDVQSSGFNYAEVFGGLDAGDFAVSCEDMFAEQRASENPSGRTSSESVSSQAAATITSADTSKECNGGHIVGSEKNQLLPNGNSAHIYDGMKQFNMSYSRTNHMGKEDVISGTIHIAQLDEITGFTFAGDSCPPSQKIYDKTPCQVTHDLNLNEDSDGKMMEGKHFRETASDAPVCDNVSKPSSSNLEADRKHLDDKYDVSREAPSADSNHLNNSCYHMPTIACPNEAFVTVSEISLRTQPSQVPPPSRPPPKLANKEVGSDRAMFTKTKSYPDGSRLSKPLSTKQTYHVGSFSETYALRGDAKDGSPHFFDVEVDASSAAAASTAAMKEAMEKAQARIKSAKESMERKRDNNQSRMKLGMNYDKKGKEKTDTTSAQGSHKIETLVAQNDCEKELSEVKYFSGVEGLKGMRGAHEIPNSEEKRAHIEVSKEFVETWQGKGSRATLESHKPEERAEDLKEEKQPYDLVKSEKFKLVEVPVLVNNEKKLKTVQKVHSFEQNEKKAAKEAFKVQNNNNNSSAILEAHEHDMLDQNLRAAKNKQEENEKILKAAHEQEEYKKRLKAAQEVCEEKDNEKRIKAEHEENEKRLKVAKEACEKEENEKRLKAAQEAREKEENEKRLKTEHEENEKRLKAANEARETEENVKRLKTEHEENEKRLKAAKEAREKEENEKKLKAEHEENEKRLKAAKEAREKEENEKRLKAAQEARRKEEHEKRLKAEHEENEKRLKAAKEAREKEENEKRLKAAKEAREKRQKAAQEAWEKEENEKRLKAAQEAREKEENEKRVQAAQEAREKEENERRLQAAQVAREKEENEKRLQAAQEAREKEENAKRLKAAQEACEKEENEKRLKAAQEAHKCEEQKLKATKEVRDHEEGKKLKAAQEEHEELAVKMKSGKEAREKEEKEMKLRAAQDAHDWEENEKKLKGACEHEAAEKRSSGAKESHEDKEHDNKIKAAEEACEWEEIGRKLKVGQDWRDCEDDKNSEAVKAALEIDDIEKELKVDKVVHEKDKKDMGLDFERKKNKELKANQDANEHEERNKSMEAANKAIRHEVDEKKLNAPKVLTQQDTVETELKAAQDMQDWEENDEKPNVAHESLGCEVNGKMKTAEEVLQDINGNRLRREAYNLEANEKQQDLDQSASCEPEKDVKKPEASKESPNLVQNETCIRETDVNLDREQNNKMKLEAVKYANCLEEKENVLQTGPVSTVSQDVAREGKKTYEIRETEEKGKEERMQKENEMLRRTEEEREREREREKDRISVERPTLEARDKASVEARERAERIAVERVTAEARQRALAEARERAEKASAEAREKSISERASIEAKIRAERAAVERATAEARERAAERAIAEARERAERAVAEKFAATSRDWRRKDSEMDGSVGFGAKDDKVMRQSRSFSDMRDSKCDPQFQGADGESAMRYKARLERYHRTSERAAKALAEKNLRDICAQREQAERNRLSESLDAEVRRWSNGKEGNLRALLSTLQYILGPDSGWQPIPLTDVITAAAVKKAYRKATLCVHPDKLQQRGASIQQKYICEKVFDLLKDAWNKFNSEVR